MPNKSVTILLLLVGVIALSGCLNHPDFNRGVCNKLNANYGSFSGTVCAQELVDNFGEELSQLRQFGNGDIADNIQNAASRKGYLNYSCNPNNLEAGVVLTDAGNCETECIQTGNQAQCSTTGEGEFAGIVSECMSHIGSGGAYKIAVSPLITAYCKKAFELFGASVGEGYPVSVSACDNRSGQQNALWKLSCYQEGTWGNQGQYPLVCDTSTKIDCAANQMECKTLSPFKAYCWSEASGLCPDCVTPGEKCGNGICETEENCPKDCEIKVPTEEPPEECPEIEGGITGPNALKIQLEWNPEKIDYKTCEKWFCDPAQATWSLLKRLHKIEDLYNETGDMQDPRMQELTSFKMSLVRGSFSKEFFKAFVDYHEKNVLFLPSWFSNWKTFLTTDGITEDRLPAQPTVPYPSGITPSSNPIFPRMGFYQSFNDQPNQLQPSDAEELGDRWYFESGTYQMKLVVWFEKNQPGFFKKSEGKTEPSAIVGVVWEKGPASAPSFEPPINPELYDLFSLNGSFGATTGYSNFFYYSDKNSTGSIVFTPTLTTNHFLSDATAKATASAIYNQERGGGVYYYSHEFKKYDVWSSLNRAGSILELGKSELSGYSAPYLFVFFTPQSIQNILVNTTGGISFLAPDGTMVLNETVLVPNPCQGEDKESVFKGPPRYEGEGDKTYSERVKAYEIAIGSAFSQACKQADYLKTDLVARWKVKPGMVEAMTLQVPKEEGELVSCLPSQQIASASSVVSGENKAMNIDSVYSVETVEQALQLVKNRLACVVKKVKTGSIRGGPNDGKPYTDYTYSIVWNTQQVKKQQNELLKKHWPTLSASNPDLRQCEFEKNPELDALVEEINTKTAQRIQESLSTVRALKDYSKGADWSVDWFKNPQITWGIKIYNAQDHYAGIPIAENLLQIPENQNGHKITLVHRQTLADQVQEFKQKGGVNSPQALPKVSITTKPECAPANPAACIPYYMKGTIAEPLVIEGTTENGIPLEYVTQTAVTFSIERNDDEIKKLAEWVASIQ